jgi:hypothetical protein
VVDRLCISDIASCPVVVADIVLNESTKNKILQDYNRAGTGVFSKEETVIIIMDLREELRQQEELTSTHKFYRRLLISAVILSLFLLASLFGLT